MLEISHLDITYGILEYAGLSDDGKKKALDCLGKKNSAGIEQICNSEFVSKEKTELIKKLVTVYGAPSNVLPMLDAFRVTPETSNAVEQLNHIFGILRENGVEKDMCIDFSLVGDMKYYNGIAMKGFIDGIPTGILSGGQYDKMMVKMKKNNARGVGFAVYISEL